MRITGWVAVGLALGLGGCGGTASAPGGGPSPSTVVTSAAAPYAGPLYVPTSPADPATVAKRSGAAGRALECDGRPYAGGAGDFSRDATSLPDGGLDRVSGSADAAFGHWAALQNWPVQGWPVPSSGYRVERTGLDAGVRRELRSYDVEGRTRVAVVVADGLLDYRGKSGWAVEAWAQCDPSEFPAAVTDALHLQVWTDAAGRRVPLTVVHSFPGAEHCDWQQATFLTLYDPDHPGDGQRPGRELGYYVRDVRGQFTGHTSSTYAAAVPVPATARDSGYRYQGRELWLSPTGPDTGPDTGPERRQAPAAYLVSPEVPGVGERWPALKQFVGCA
ncbi:hypothetical protein ACIB24_09665 [Spongisporangium articulatum]|uniref:Lipoprotein n=1 Tax=Spongisporangium articulatum TaxID=3362603 RepID=A0ABW8ANY9_9ACTN